MNQRVYCSYVPTQYGFNYAQLVFQLLKCFFTQLVCSMSQVLKGRATQTAAFLWADKQIGKMWIDAQSSNSHNLKRAFLWIDESQLLKSYTWSQNENFYEINFLTLGDPVQETNLIRSQFIWSSQPSESNPEWWGFNEKNIQYTWSDLQQIDNT